MLEDRIEKWYNKYGKGVSVFLGVIIVGYLIFRFNIVGLFAPFIVAFIFATFLNKVVTWAQVQLKLPRSIGTIVSMLTILTGVLTVIGMLIKKLWIQVVNFTAKLPDTTDQIVAQIGGVEEKLDRIFSLSLSGIGITDLDTLVEQVMDGITSFLTSALPAIYDAAAKVPNVVIFVITMLLATFFMTKDYYIIKKFIKAQFSDTIIDKMVLMQHGIFDAIGGYLRTQVILMSLTFIICMVGLFIFGVDYALLLAVIIAIVDALPVFGSGTILIPWGVYNLLVGNLTLGVGLLCIYGVIFVVRQIMEPKILSSQIGVYALVTLMAVYVGYRVLGFIGLILGPAIVVVLQMLQNVGVLPKFKPVYKTEIEGEQDERD